MYIFKQLFCFYAVRNKQKKINKWDSAENLVVNKMEKKLRSEKESNFLLMYHWSAMIKIIKDLMRLEVNLFLSTLVILGSKNLIKY